MNVVALSLLTGTFYLLPFLLGFTVNKCKPNTNTPLMTYRFFVLFNVVFSGLSVCIRTLSTHLYSPSHDMIVAAILAMVVFSCYAIWQQGSIRLAPALVWGLFVLFGAVFHALELFASSSKVKNPAMLWLHITYDLLVFATLIVMYIKLFRPRRRGAATFTAA